MHVLHIIFLKKLKNYTPKIVDIILIWAVYPRYSKYLYYLIRDLLAFSLNIIIITSNIIFSKLDFVFNARTSINISYFYIIKGAIYPI